LVRVGSGDVIRWDRGGTVNAPAQAAADENQPPPKFKGQRGRGRGGGSDGVVGDATARKRNRPSPKKGSRGDVAKQVIKRRPRTGTALRPPTSRGGSTGGDGGGGGGAPTSRALDSKKPKPKCARAKKSLPKGQKTLSAMWLKPKA
jgi:hypothetical protein